LIKNRLLLFFIPVALIAWSLLNASADDNPHGDISFDCELCHSAEGWAFKAKAIDFRHEDTGFPLIGAHVETGCKDCHESLVFAHIGTSCIDCHIDVHSGEFGLNCDNCHVPISWENRFPVWEEHNRTRFPLLGFHANLDCESCHRDAADREYTTPVECNGCHNKDFMSSRNPDHQLAGFDSQCEGCHSPASISWQQVQYTHPTIFILRGAHQNIECLSCHQSRYTGTESSCENCHMEDYNATMEPDHSKFGFPLDCAACHDEWQWENTVFDHISFPWEPCLSGHPDTRGRPQLRIYLYIFPFPVLFFPVPLNIILYLPRQKFFSQGHMP